MHGRPWISACTVCPTPASKRTESKARVHLALVPVSQPDGLARGGPLPGALGGRCTAPTCSPHRAAQPHYLPSPWVCVPPRGLGRRGRRGLVFAAVGPACRGGEGVARDVRRGRPAARQRAILSRRQRQQLCDKGGASRGCSDCRLTAQPPHCLNNSHGRCGKQESAVGEETLGPQQRPSACCSNGGSWAAAAGRWQLGGGGAARLCSPSFRACTVGHSLTPRSTKNAGG